MTPADPLVIMVAKEDAVFTSDDGEPRLNIKLNMHPGVKFYVFPKERKDGKAYSSENAKPQASTEDAPW